MFLWNVFFISPWECCTENPRPWLSQMEKCMGKKVGVGSGSVGKPIANSDNWHLEVPALCFPIGNNVSKIFLGWLQCFYNVSHPATIRATSVPDDSTKAWAIPRSHTWKVEFFWLTFIFTLYFFLEKKITWSWSSPRLGNLSKRLDLKYSILVQYWMLRPWHLIQYWLLLSWHWFNIECFLSWQTWRREATNGLWPRNMLSDGQSEVIILKYSYICILLWFIKKIPSGVMCQAFAHQGQGQSPTRL